MTVPTPEEIRAARLATGLTQKQAGELVHVAPRTWKRWEHANGGPSGRKMSEATWELFRVKTAMLR
jgi:DNA-binding transcriptional regulator YiaG